MNDIGMLWENFLFIERMKTCHYHKIYANAFFWRTYDQQEIDLVEERNGGLFAYEFKCKAKKNKAPKLWTNTYPDSDFATIDRENYMDFLLEEGTNT